MATQVLLNEHALDGEIYSGGWIPGAGRLSIEDPASGATVAEVGSADAAQVRAAATAAAAAQPGWAALEPEARGKVMSRMAALIEGHREEVVDWLTREAGSIGPKGEAEIGLTLGELDEAAKLALRLGEEETIEGDGRTSRAVHVPIGVVGVITPWNFPLILAMRSVAPALALGNAVVLKCDPHTPVSGGLLIAALLQEAGLPEGVFHALPGDGAAGAALTSAPEVGMVSFTGSTAAGRKVGAICGENLKRVTLELGGKNALIVLDDADLEAASSCGAWGAFLHQGQICMATGRHLVHERIADAYVEALVERARRLPAGDPSSGEVALGPIINQRQFDHVSSVVADTVAAGAQVAVGGTGERPYYPATVLTNVRADMRAWREEVFGPVAPVMTFSSDEEAIAMANDTEYGLSGGIVTSSPERGRKVADALRTGMVHINDQSVNGDARMPFGGMGASGNGGRFGTPANLHEFTEYRWISERAEPATYPF